MKLRKPREIHMTVCVPCDLCGQHLPTVSFYLEAKGERKVIKGFYSDLAIRLCEKCVDKIKDIFREDDEGN